MKNICIAILLLTHIGCAIAWLSPRAFPERRYRPCQDVEVKSGSATGKFCHRYCAEYKALHSDISENCSKWVTDIRDVTQDADFRSFRDGGFILINEQRVR